MKPSIHHLFLILCILSNFYSFGQIPHEHPDHPKGDSYDQYQALPYYNEACELYQSGKVKQAKTVLYEAINISFALTEAQLFLADILYQEGVQDSALYFYKSGIDFAIEQKANYYFKLFETAMLLGQYDIVQQNLKYFHKVHGSKGYEAPYEDLFPYDRSDYEFYENAIELVYDFKSWKPTAEVKETYDTSYHVKSNGILSIGLRKDYWSSERTLIALNGDQLKV
jgi:hypothetical protein